MTQNQKKWKIKQKITGYHSLRIKNNNKKNKNRKKEISLRMTKHVNFDFMYETYGFLELIKKSLKFETSHFAFHAW